MYGTKVSNIREKSVSPWNRVWEVFCPDCKEVRGLKSKHRRGLTVARCFLCSAKFKALCNANRSIGKVYGRVKVISADPVLLHPIKPGKNMVRVIGECECGVVKSYVLQYLKTKQVVSCGCYQKEVLQKVGKAVGRTQKGVSKSDKWFLTRYGRLRWL